MYQQNVVVLLLYIITFVNKVTLLSVLNTKQLNMLNVLCDYYFILRFIS